MNHLSNQKRALTNRIMDKTISLLEACLQDDRKALTVRDSIMETYRADTNSRARLYRDFYQSFETLFTFNILEKSFNNPESMWPFRIDQAAATLMERHIPKRTLRKYQTLMERVLDKFMDLDPKNHSFYEVYFSGFHLDLFYFAGIRIREEMQSFRMDTGSSETQDAG